MAKHQVSKSTNQWMTYSLPLFLALIGLMGVLICHFHSMQTRAIESYQKIRSSHGIALQLFELSNKMHHLQLDVHNYAFFPGKKRFHHIEHHKKEFNEKLASLLSLQNQSEVFDKVTADALLFVQAKYPELEKRWDEIMALANERAEKPILAKAMKDSEIYFDDMDYAAQLDQVIIKHAEQINRYEKEMSDVLQNRNGIIGLLLALCFGFMVAFIHRKALRAQQMELALVHANKMACIGEMSMGLAKELQIPLMKIQGFNGRLKAHFKKDRMDEVSSVWTYTHEIDESVTQMRSHLERLM